MQSAANRYTLYGALFGTCFPVLATVLAAYLGHGSVDWSRIAEVQRLSPLLWIIDSAPFWLGVFARFGGMQLDRLQATHARLQQSEQRFRSVVDSLGEGVVLTDLAGRVTYANSPASTLAGSHGSRLEDLLRRAPVELSDAAAASRRARYETMELEVAESGRVTVELRRSLVPGAPGREPELLAVITDVTSRVELEEQLRQSQKMEAVGQLAGGIAHDFNNMLTVISGFATLLEAELDPADPRHEHAHEIRKAAARSADLTRQLLAFSRRQFLQPRIFDMNEVLLSMDQMLRRLIGADIEFVARCASELPSVVADPGQLEQVLLNLVVNARDALSGGGRLLIETRSIVVDETPAGSVAELPPGPYVLLRVSDTGCGMDRETQARIFEPFFTTKPIGGGTGLGLSTVYGIVKQTGGHIAVDSVAGEGTTFHLYIPCARSHSSSEDIGQATARALHGVTSLALQGMTLPLD